jgi:hypothetical protein
VPYSTVRAHLLLQYCLDTFLIALEAFMAGEIEHPVEDVENRI